MNKQMVFDPYTAVKGDTINIIGLSAERVEDMNTKLRRRGLYLRVVGLGDDVDVPEGTLENAFISFIVDSLDEGVDLAERAAQNEIMSAGY